MAIRQAKPEDWQDIQTLNRQIFEHELHIEPTSNLDYPYTAEAVAYFKRAAEGRDDHVAFVSEEDGHLIGYAIAKLLTPGDVSHRVGVNMAQLHTLSVDEAHRGQGIGKALIDATRQWATEQGANRLKIVTYAGNERARALYSRMGFEEHEVAYELKLAGI